MYLETDFATISDAATRADVIELIRTLGTGRRSMAILGSADEVYIQTNYLADRDMFNLDYRDGGPDKHYQVNVPTRDIVEAAFLSYLDGDDHWRTMVEWERDTHYEEILRRQNGRLRRARAPGGARPHRPRPRVTGPSRRFPVPGPARCWCG